MELAREWILFDIFLFSRQIKSHVVSLTVAEKATFAFFFGMAARLSAFYFVLARSIPSLAEYYWGSWIDIESPANALRQDIEERNADSSEADEIFRDALMEASHSALRTVIYVLIGERCEEHFKGVQDLHEDLANLSVRLAKCICGTGEPSMIEVESVGKYFLKATLINEKAFEASMRKVKVVL